MHNFISTQQAHTLKNMLQTGISAPDFELLTAKKEVFRLSSLQNKKSVVLYFYPKNDTRGCTAEACSFRDQYEIFQEQGAEVVGVSSDNLDSHQNFSAKYQLPFILLSDPGGKVRKLYEVPKTLGLIPGRATYVIDIKGIIRYSFNAQLKPLEHVQNALQILKTLTTEA
ncbi:peroxiredoxin [Adhaeribacter pallidiroseus]|uniref:thioredoxin-dependent peroxiredoxin n=1 Tax=Adhaeribacter pallidiroseus TaxID=2072847 RepID=A0A369QIV3_9BACT|nr:peroxiredoxin [Adhaeribacter pallidiroseus]RDC62809.1 Peroxiredoxin [Adhaeribacter pallidiroseus]